MAYIEQNNISKKIKPDYEVSVYKNLKTGETVDAKESDAAIDYKDRGFNKFFKKAYYEKLETMNSKSVVTYKLLSYLMGHLKNTDNTISISQRDCAKEIKASHSSVSTAFTELQAADFIRQVKTGYMINPEIILYGGYTKHEKLISKYNTLEKKHFLKP